MNVSRCICHGSIVLSYLYDRCDRRRHRYPGRKHRCDTYKQRNAVHINGDGWVR
ncbi:hypothetical protein VB711_25875 [Cronbergia sp. UHCC 0137]|uniref:hypothetical protein n=1 Tax=Cronbergia sp. UHCC 0137 TaxID=3110239 RepID=UPI002B1F33E0|nr:hypothetical protein [Cronbergia sp. UHCC 0137]MEA5621238.1 hypothetical protein [Cronbergia sp. UHCC 0137]